MIPHFQVGANKKDSSKDLEYLTTCFNMLSNYCYSSLIAILTLASSLSYISFARNQLSFRVVFCTYSLQKIDGFQPTDEVGVHLCP